MCCSFFELISYLRKQIIAGRCWARQLARAVKTSASPQNTIIFFSQWPKGSVKPWVDKGFAFQVFARVHGFGFYTTISAIGCQLAALAKTNQSRERA